PLWNPQGVRERFRTLLAVVALAVFCVTPQLVIYKLATGSWLVSPYGQLGRFDLTAPHLWSVLFGVTKGLFFWSPVLLLAALGVVFDHPLGGRLRAAALLTFTVLAYLIASWSDWQFGASFGHRGFTDGLAIAAVFLAVFFDRVQGSRRLLVPVTILATTLTALSSAQMFQYWMGILPNADTTWSQYQALFL